MATLIQNSTWNAGVVSILSTPSSLFLLGVALLCFYLIKHAYETDFPAVKGVPSVPGADPFIGHLRSLGGRRKMNDATVFTEWSKKLGAGLFQIKLGYQRCLVVNSWSTMKDFWVTRNTSILHRPLQAEFMDFVGVDISGGSWTDQIKRCRSAAVKALGRPMWKSYYPLMEPNAEKLIREVHENGKDGTAPVDLFPWLRQMVTDLTLYITYGARAGDFDNDLTNTLLQSIADVTSVRGSTAAYRQYVPLLRLRPVKTSTTIEAVQVRQKCIEKLYAQYLDKYNNDEVPPRCIVSSLSSDKLSLDEIHGTCISLLQAAPDTIASGIYQCCAWLCIPENQPFQRVLLEAILAEYDGDRDEAWKMAFREEKVPLVVSLYKETLRFYSTAPYVGRRTTKEIKMDGLSTLPQGIQMIINIQAVNHDIEHYGPSANEFNPRRFLNDATPLPHLSYGTGGRICPAYQLSNRIIYAMLVRLTLAFEMKQFEGGRLPSTDMIDFSDGYGLVAHPRPFDCAFIPRDSQWLEKVTGAD